MNVYGESIYGTTATNIPEQSWGVTTCKGSRLFLHLIEPLEGVEVISLPLPSAQKSCLLVSWFAQAATPTNHRLA